MINTITALINIGNDAKQIIDTLERMIKVSIPEAEQAQSIEELQKGMRQFYAIFEDDNKDLELAKNVIENDALDANQIASDIGEILDDNFKIANGFVKNILLLLNNYDMKNDLYKQMSEKTSKIKNKMNKFKYQIDAANQTINKI